MAAFYCCSIIVCNMGVKSFEKCIGNLDVPIIIISFMEQYWI